MAVNVLKPERRQTGPKQKKKNAAIWFNKIYRDRISESTRSTVQQ